METENNTQLTPVQTAQVAVTLAFAAYGAYQIGALTGRWIAVAIHDLKNRKNES